MRKDSEKRPAKKRIVLGQQKQDEILSQDTRPRREIWLELMAVLAIGVIPSAVSSFAWGVAPPVQWPYWLDSLNLSVRNICISATILYLIYRSNEPWSKFGISRPRLIDLPVALLVPWAYDQLWSIHWGLVQIVLDPERLFLPPTTATDHVLMIFRSITIGFAEELVFRAYLITRLEYLLASRTKTLLITSVMFPMGHFHFGINLVIFYTAAGIMFGLIYLILRRIWPVAVGHALTDISADLQNAMANAL
jgi:membrane protease YdiL (CAAX protease family)